jgi:hypothetical protein
MIPSAVSKLSRPINTQTSARNAASDGHDQTQAHNSTTKHEIKEELTTAPPLFAIEERSTRRPANDSRRLASRVKRITPVVTSKFHWEGVGSSFNSTGSSFVSAASQSSMYQYVDEDFDNGEEEEKSSTETVRTRRRSNMSVRNSFRRSLHDTLLDDNERTAFSTTLTKSEFLAEIMNGFLDATQDCGNDDHLACATKNCQTGDRTTRESGEV